MRKVVNLTQRPDGITIFSQLLISFGTTSLCALAFSYIGLIMASLATGYSIMDFASPSHDYNTDAYINGLKVLQIVSVIGLFMVPALVLPKILFNTNPIRYNGLSRRSPFILFVLAVLVFIALIPFLEWITDVNMRMKFPASMQGLYDWMKKLEDMAGETTAKFLEMKTPMQLLVNVIMVAALAAICEELFFRGFLQRTIYYWWGRKHLAVILTAFIFSFIHFQFFGFLTRMVLGLFLGYLYLWSGNLRVSMFMHFTNNFIPVFLSYQEQQSGKPYDINATTSYPPLVTVLSLVVSCALMFLFYKISRKPSNIVRNQLGINNPDEKWELVHTVVRPEEAEIIAGQLKSHGIPTVVVNKRDSSYLLFGHVEIYVRPEDAGKAAELIHSHDL